MAAVATSIPASMKRETLTLNPNAPLFVPAAFLSAEDFSPEWWCLVHTCPAFREYWLHEYCLTDPDQVLLQHHHMAKKGENDGFDHGSAEVEVEVEVDLAMEFNKFQVDSENMPPFSSTEKIDMVLSHLKPKKKKKQEEMYSKPLPPPKPILRPQKSALCSKTIHQPR